MEKPFQDKILFLAAHSLIAEHIKEVVHQKLNDHPFSCHPTMSIEAQAVLYATWRDNEIVWRNCLWCISAPPHKANQSVQHRRRKIQMQTPLRSIQTWERSAS